MGRFKAPARRAGGNYLSQAEKELLGEEGAITPVLGVQFDSGGGYKGGDRFVLKTEIEGEEKAASFGVAAAGSSRDDLLAAMQDYIEEGGEDELFVLWETIPGQGAQSPFINLIAVDAEGNEIEQEEDEESAGEEEAEAEPVRPARRTTTTRTKSTAKARTVRK